MQEREQASRNKTARQALGWGLRALAVTAGLAMAAVLIMPSSTTQGVSAARAEEVLRATVQGFGYTLDALTGSALGGVTVTVDGTNFTSDGQGRYEVSGLNVSHKLAIASKSGYAPNAVHFSVHQTADGSTSVHLLPLYMLALEPTSSIPGGGGVVVHGSHQLSFSSGGFSAGITGYGEHPGTPAPPELIPTPTSPQQPRLPIVATASPVQQAFPQSVFYAEMPDGVSATATVPLGVSGADLSGGLLPLLRFDTATGDWVRDGDLTVIASNLAQGPITQEGLYMVVTIGVIETDQLILTGETIASSAPFSSGSLGVTLPTTFEIGPATSSDVRAATFWLYGRREGSGNLLGMQANGVTTDGSDALTAILGGGFSFKDATGTTGEVEPTGVEPTGPTGPTGPSGPSYCPSGIFPCPSGSTPCFIAPRTVNGCGEVTTNGDCACCPSGTACGGEVTIGAASDKYDIKVGVQEIARQVEGKAEKRKEDMSVGAICAEVGGGGNS